MVDVLFENYNVNDGTDTHVQIYGNIWRGQTFTLGTVSTNGNHIITSIKLYISKTGLNPGIITVSIRETDGTGLPIGIDLSTGTTNGDTLPDFPVAEWREIIMTPYVLVASQKYAIIVRCLTGDAVNSVNWVTNSNPLYAGGEIITSMDNDITWTVNPAADRLFEEYGIAIKTISEKYCDYWDVMFKYKTEAFNKRLKQ